ncbi:Ribokinase-like protein [Russula compacta]|nr:Ribokinase-like protein [Russula compacta]
MMYSFLHSNRGDTPAILTIAGSDSGGGAGIQADLKTFTALGCYGATIVTALTAQNTKGIQAVHTVPPSFIEQQLRSVLDDIDVAGIKTGMLANADIVRAVAHTLKALPSPPPSLVIDPVCISTSGHTLLEHEALGTLVAELLPLAAALTPNTSEAALLLQHRPQSRRAGAWEANGQIASVEDMVRASRELCALGPRAVLLKGGHRAHGDTHLADVEAVAAKEDLRVHGIECGGWVRHGANMEILFQAAAAARGQDPAAVRDVPVVVDVLFEAGDRGSGRTGGCTLFVRPYLDSTSTHGTGCTLSAALACALACGEPLIEAVKFATMYTHYGIATAFPIGSGHGPLNHMHPLLPRVLRRPTQNDPYPLVRTLILANAGEWKQYVQHDFVKQLGQGTLSRERFIHFIKQDYLYLKYYARANSLLAAKSPEYADIAAAADVVLAIVTERQMHASFSAQWGVDLAELESTQESPACTAYGAYLIDVGLQGALRGLFPEAACLLGYGEVGLWLQREAKQPRSRVEIENNPYRKWIEDYSGEEYQAAVKVGIERIEALAVDDPPSPKKLEHWKEIWGRCTRLERQFWDMAMNLS